MIKKILFTLLSIVLFCSDVFSQEEIKKDYSFLKHQANRISYSADSSAFMKLFDKIDRVASGATEQVKIVHIGGSHVQAGLWSSAFLNAFHQKFITAGGGYFVFPYRIGKTNGQPFATSFSDGNWTLCRSIGRDFCEPLGLCALNLHTSDSASRFGVKLTDRAKARFVNTIRVFHNFNERYQFGLEMSDSIKVQREDHRALGYTSFSLLMPVDSFSFRLLRLDSVKSDFIIYGFSLENDLAPGFYLAALGANGASTTSFLKAKDLEQQLSSLKADLFILSLGVNDTQSAGFTKENFIAGYDTLIRKIRAASPDAAILLTTTTDNYIRRRTPNRRSITARDAMFQLMLTHDIGVWDLFSLMGGYRSIYTWYRTGLASRDKVHFNGRGYRLVGDLMFDAVIKSWQFNADNQ